MAYSGAPVFACIFVLLFVTTNGNGATQSADGVWIQDGEPVSCPGKIGDGYCWYVTETALSWEESKARCEEVPGSTLATLESAFHVELSKDNAAGGTNLERWIGYRIQQSPGIIGRNEVLPYWQQFGTWADGSTTTYTNWGDIEPNNSGNKPELCTHMWRSDNQWNDEECSRPKRALCRFKTNLKCGRRRFVSWGDPHYTTWDGLKFDFMGMGLYTTCQSPQWQVTSCHEPYRHNSNAAVQKAMHVQLTQGHSLIIAPNRVSGLFSWFYDNHPLQLPVRDFFILPGGEEIKHEQTKSGLSRYELTTHDGYQLHFTTRQGHYVDVRFYNFGTTSDDTAIEGICGSPDCDPSNDYKARDGTIWPLSNSESWYHSSITWHTSNNPFEGISSHFVCETANVSAPDPGSSPPAPIPIPNCNDNPTGDDLAACECCTQKNGGATSGADFEACLLDLSLSENIEEACSLIPDESCEPGCQGECDAGECVCPNGAEGPLCESECCSDREVFEGTCSRPTPTCVPDGNGGRLCTVTSTGTKVQLTFD